MEENKILAYVRGNDVLFIVTVTTPEIDGEGQPIEDSYVPVDFTGWDDYSLRVVKQGVTRTVVAESSQLVEGEDGKIVVDVPYTALCGTYSLELVGRQNGRHERSYEIMMFEIVESNDKANLIYEVIDGYKSTDLDITVQLVQSALVYGENAYQMWKHLPGNEDKTLQDYIDEVLDLASMTQECADIIENAKPDLIYEDNYVYRWNPVTHAYAKTNIYVKGDQGEQGEQGIQGIQGVQGIQGERGLQGEHGVKGDDGIGISGIEFEETDENGNNVYNIYTTDENSYQLVSPRGPSGQDGQDGTDGAPGLPGADGQDGITPHIDVTTGNWFVGSTDTGIHAQGQQGIQGPAGQDGQDGQNGTNGTNGVDGITPHIDSTNKHWMIGTEDTGIVAEGQDGRDGTNGTNGTNGTDGADGITPHIDSTTGNWFIGDENTGVHAQGPQGVPGTTPDISGKEDKVDIVSASGATLAAEVGKYYTLSNVGTLAITLPTIAAGTAKVQTVTFYIAAGSTPAVTFTSTHSIYYSDGFEIAANSTYEVSAAYNGIAWVVASVKIVIPT